MMDDKQLERIAQTLYDTVARAACKVFDARGLPVCRLWDNLSSIERQQTINRLRGRVEREGLAGYLARRRKENPSAQSIYDDTERALKALRLL